MKDWVFFLVASIVIMLGSYGAVVSTELLNLKAQAIEKGHAEYVVDKWGKPTWKWKD